MDQDSEELPARIQALDNLLALWGLARRPNAFGGGIVIYHPGYHQTSTWLDYTESEAQWVEHIQWFVGTFRSVSPYR